MTYIKGLQTPIAIVGLGKSGLAAYQVLLAAGFSEADLILFDEKLTSAQVNNWSELLRANCKTWVVSPGVPLQHEAVRSAVQSEIHITSEISIAASLLTDEKVIGITGSVGKSTVTSLIGTGALVVDSTAFVGGNLGTPFCDYALRLLTGGQKAQWIILEISSYQLENCKNLQLDFSVITFLSPNHLERYSSLHEYYMTKMKITEITKTTCVMNSTSPDVRHYSESAQSRVILTNAETFSASHKLPQIFMLGSHNRDNFAVAAQIAELAGWPASTLQKMAEYKGLPHRLEFVGHINNITYINDSKATAMDSVMVATLACLEGVAENGKLFLLLGGKDKNLPWQDLADLQNLPQIVPVFFGACGQLAKNKSNLAGEYYEKLGRAVEYAKSRAQSGDVILLSPGGTSLDEFKNFEERGNFFKSLVLS